MLIIKRIISLFAAAALLTFTSADADNVPAVSAKCCAVMYHGRCLYEKNADLRVPIASTTKLMTAVVVIENCDMDEIVTIDSECCGIEGSSMYLEAGQELTTEELLKGLLLVSGNDAAAALAKHTAGSVDAFAELMNRKAAELGMDDTHFTNPHGLNDPMHYSTARDMARLMEYCLQNSIFREINALKSCTVNGLTLINHNKLLLMCRGCTGGKTGFTEAAGRCLVSSCERNGAELVCVTLNDPDDWKDHLTLYDRAYSEYELRNVTDGIRFSVPIISAETDRAYLIPEGSNTVFIKRGSEAKLTARLPWFVFAPVQKGEAGGKAEISVDGEQIGEYYLVYSDNIPLGKDNS
ncbi:MAG: D-alanyl-D-alanine carboxypeptidase family protein [Eubacteriales bacterium]|nr:D-alanyl-D-alanine carboxypeptidase family protein [Eubacteriales bacterium]